MFKKTVSLTGFTSFVILLVTSVVLYFEPHGRVAYWGDWRFLGMTKTDWDDIHIVVGAVFLVAVCLHIWLNWKPVVAYMRNKARELVVLTPAMIVALIITLYFTIGAVAGLPVARQVLDFSAYLKDSHTETYGNPPYGHAELSSLSKFTRILGFDTAEALLALRDAGIREAGPEAVIADIARANDTSPQQIYAIIRDALAGDPFAALPPSPPEGTGKMTLIELSGSFGLPQDQALARLAESGLTATPDMTLKQIAASGNITPQEVYALLQGK